MLIIIEQGISSWLAPQTYVLKTILCRAFTKSKYLKYCLLRYLFRRTISISILWSKRHMLYPYMDLDLSKIMDAHNIKSTLLVFVKHIILFHERLQRRSNSTNYGIRCLLWTFLRDGYYTELMRFEKYMPIFLLLQFISTIPFGTSISSHTS